MMLCLRTGPSQADSAGWVPFIAYDDALGLPSGQDFSLGGNHWNGVAPDGSEPFFSQMIEVGGNTNMGAEVYIRRVTFSLPPPKGTVILVR